MEERDPGDPALQATAASGEPRADLDTIPVGGAGAPRIEPRPLPEVDGTRYRLAGEVGRGGLGRVLRARDLVLDRTVAIKELLDPSGTPERRFVREVLITARLQHPGIVPVYEAGRWRDRAPFYAMPLLGGRPMSRLLDDATTLERRLALVPNVLAVADAIAYAHSRRIIHRDLKPANVLIGEFGETVVIDWGLAKDLSIDDTEALDAGPYRAAGTDQTVAGALLGTPAYMPPEQADGLDVDERADVYALGAMLYQVLTGKVPHQGGDLAEVLRRVIAGDVVPVARRTAHVPADLAAIVDKAMARVPDQRYASAAELAEDLRRFLAGQLVGVYRYSPRERLWRWVRRHRAAVSVGLLSLAVVAVGAIIAVSRVLSERDDANRQKALALVRGDEASRARGEAQQRLVATYEELGRRELVAGEPVRALAYLAEAYRTSQGSPTLRYLVGAARRLTGARPVAAFDYDARWHDVRFSDDGRLIMSAGRGALLAEIATGRIVLRTDEETAAGFSADGSRAAVQGPDGEHLIETASGARLAALDAGDGSADDLIRIDYVFSPDGRRLVTLGNAASLLDAGSGRRVASIGETFVETASVDRAGGRVAITYDDGVSVWDAAGRALAHRLDGSRLAVFTPDGARLVTATYWDDGEHTTIRDPATLQIERDISGTVGAAERVFFAPDGSRLAVTGQGKVDVWATADWTLEQSLDGAVVDVSFASGRLLVARRADQTEVRDLDSGGVLAVIPGAAAAISRDGTRVATWYDTIDASRSDQLVIWDLGPARWRTLASTQLLQPLHDGTIAIERAVSCCQATVWDVAAGARSRQLDHLAGIADDGRSFGAWVDGALELRDAHDQLLARLAIAPPEGRVVTGGGWVVVVRSDGLELWSLAAGARVSSLSGSWRELALEAAAPLGVRADRDRVEVAELATGVVIARFDVADVADVAISPDGSYLVIAARRGDEDVAVSVLDVKTGGQLTSFEQGNDELRLDPTGRRLLVGGLLRDLRTGALIAVLEEGASARYAPAGDRIVGGDSMTTIRDGATGLVLAAEPGFRGGSSGDGAWLAVGARVLDQRPEAAPPDEVAAFARCRAPFQIEGGRLVPADLDLAACIQP